jgi:hypothetical protein
MQLEAASNIQHIFLLEGLSQMKLIFLLGRRRRRRTHLVQFATPSDSMRIRDVEVKLNSYCSLSFIFLMQ